MMYIITLLATVFIFSPVVASANTSVIEGDDAKALLEENAASSHILKQKKKLFHLISNGGSEERKPSSLTIKKGDTIFITNEEKKFVHNVYDSSDQNWVLQKQLPGEVAAITFNEPGVHKLRCAIHPKMKITVTVE